MNFNQTIIAGYLVRDPELTFTKNEMAVANFDIATNYKRGQVEETCFIHCSAFGNLGENIVKYFTKGKPIFVVGRLQQNRWEADDGSKRSRIQVVVENFRFVESGGSNPNPQPNRPERLTPETNENIALDREEDVFK